MKRELINTDTYFIFDERRDLAILEIKGEEYDISEILSRCFDSNSSCANGFGIKLYNKRFGFIISKPIGSEMDNKFDIDQLVFFIHDSQNDNYNENYKDFDFEKTFKEFSGEYKKGKIFGLGTQYIKLYNKRINS